MNITALKDIYLSKGITGTKTLNFCSSLLMQDKPIEQITLIQTAGRKVSTAKLKTDIASAIYPLFTKKVTTETEFNQYFNI